MKRVAALTLIVFAFIICKPVPAVAETSRLRLRILPLDCIFEIIQDGTNEIIYITPIECGQLIEDDENINLPGGIKPNRPAGESTYIPFIIRANNRIPNSDNKDLVSNDSPLNTSPLPHPHEDNDDNNTDSQGKSLIRTFADFMFFALLLGFFIFILLKNRRGEKER